MSEDFVNDYKEALNARFGYHAVSKMFEELKQILQSDNHDENKWKKAESNNTIQSLRRFVEQETRFSTIDPGTVVYRARKIDTKAKKSETEFIIDNSNNQTITGYDSINSKEPAVGLSGAGRANPKASSYFYAAEDLYTACSEIKTVQRSCISVAQFEIINPLRVVDFCNRKEQGAYPCGLLDVDYRTLLGVIAFAFAVPIQDEKEYFVTQYSADMIRKYGVDGIVYPSFYSLKKNYAIFNCAPKNLRFVKSEIVVNYSQTNLFLRINNLEEVTSAPITLTQDDKNAIKQTILHNFSE